MKLCLVILFYLAIVASAATFVDGYSSGVIDYCASGPCLNSGTCRNAWWLGGGYICYCPDGYTGLNCQVCINPCEFDQVGYYSACQNGARCVFNETACGKYECKCEAGFVGEQCEYRVNPCSVNPCQNEGTCNVITEGTAHSPGQFTCTCKPGVLGSLCDVFADPCKYRKCDNGAACVALSNNTYEEIKTRFGQSTRFIMGRSNCSCDPDYSIGPNCEFTIDPCNARSTPPCYNNAPCRSLTNATFYSSGIYECECPDGTLGPRCDHYVDPCRYQPCVNKGQCRTKSNNTYYGGKRPSGGGIFIQSLGEYECECPVGYSTGKNCQYLLDPCDERPCQNGGTCVKVSDGKLISRSFSFFSLTYWLVGDFKCECVNGFKGDKCQLGGVVGQEARSSSFWSSWGDDNHQDLLAPSPLMNMMAAHPGAAPASVFDQPFGLV